MLTRQWTTRSLATIVAALALAALAYWAFAADRSVKSLNRQIEAVSSDVAMVDSATSTLANQQRRVALRLSQQLEAERKLAGNLQQVASLIRDNAGPNHTLCYAKRSDCSMILEEQMGNAQSGSA